MSAQKPNSSSSNDAAQYEHELKQKTSVLDSIKEELKRGRQKLSELETQEGSEQDRIQQIEKNIMSSKTYLDLLSHKIDSFAVQITVLKDSASIAAKRLVERQTIMERRLRQAYMSGTPNALMLLLTSESPTDFINKNRYVQELNRYDKELLRQITKARTDFDDRKNSYQGEREKLNNLVSSKMQEHETLVKEEEQRKSILEDVRTKKKSFEKMVAELEQSQKQLDDIIKTLENKRKKVKQQPERKNVVAFEKRKGKLPWPLSGTVVSKFGKLIHPVYKTVTMNNGIDIQPKGSGTVQSVAAGTIIHTGVMRGLGKIVIVDHSGGYITVYAHLSQIDVKVNQDVDNGTVIGKVDRNDGDGNLHFEIRRSTDALDPSIWLE